MSDLDTIIEQLDDLLLTQFALERELNELNARASKLLDTI